MGKKQALILWMKEILTDAEIKEIEVVCCHTARERRGGKPFWGHRRKANDSILV